MPTTISIDGRSLDLTRLAAVAAGETVSLAPTVVEQIKASRRVVERVLATERTVYGINTGFGRLSSKRVAPDQLRQLQRNLVRSHSAGVGECLPPDQVRAMIVLRANSLVQGFSGVRLELVEALLAMLNAGITPLVPSRGSVGASGDLAPLAHVALGLMGEGQCHHQGQNLPAAEALARAGLSPVEYEAKEALALINGTQLMTAVGGLALERAGRLLKAADIVGAMSLEALLGTDSVFDPAIHACRPHPGQVQVADNLRRCLSGSELIASHVDCPKVQDPYSLRCIPQVHGASRDGWSWAVSVVEREMNAASDNPVVLPESDRIMSGGNFHGAPVALALDCAAVALSYLGSMSERRCDKLLNPDESGLPAFLVRDSGLNSGLMLTQYVSAALVNEIKVLSHPASSDSVPTSAGHEDHVSMGPGAAYKLEVVVKNLEQIVANEWLCACQALEFHRPLSFGPATEIGLACLREQVACVTDDRPLAEDLATARELIANGELVRRVEGAIGDLEALMSSSVAI
ncbi:MAG: histidine ammonia-lyase [Candidatus Eremiobacteraeota bacterium]|nr:histidine ammonia-lyase [Candidatus Eremiobacteraeota bacterium]